MQNFASNKEKMSETKTTNYKTNPSFKGTLFPIAKIFQKKGYLIY